MSADKQSQNHCAEQISVSYPVIDSYEFDAWVRAVKKQMIAALRKRGME